MARRPKGNPIHGWLILDKPIEMTSTQAVAVVKRLFNAQKAGHGGTLDPLATGLLPIALGEATKTMSFAVEGAKGYRFTVRWGAETTTDDAEGEVARASDARPTLDDIEALAQEFIGEIEQVPPQFSAIKVEGNRAYDLARDGETVDLKPRIVVVDDLRIVDMPDAATTVFEADCGKGTYVRAIARDMGRRLGCYGHVIALRRTRVGPFTLDDSIGLDALRAAAGENGVAPLAALLPVEAALADLNQVDVAPNDAARLRRGQSIILRGRDAPLPGSAYAICRGQLVALGEVERGELLPTRVFNLGGGQR
ncbi:MAG: tRNA pseudouridine(55) synthase TruB [Hyphomicrobiaceae bacterium]